MAKSTKTIFHKVDLSEIKGCTVTANRWTDSVNTTYHSVYISVLVPVDLANQLNANVYNRPDQEMIWVDLCENVFESGYDRGYEQTAYKLFKESVNGNFQDLENVKVGYISTACQMLMIPYFENVYDVKRKKDM